MSHICLVLTDTSTNAFYSLSRTAMEPDKEKEIVIGAAEAAAKFFRDPRSHGAPKEYTTQVTAVMSRTSVIFLILSFFFLILFSVLCHADCALRRICYSKL
jgi:hypothetical protein